MTKRLLLISIPVILMLVCISFASAVDTDTTNAEKNESPLYAIRTKRAIGEKISLIIGRINTKALGERIFFIPFQLVKNHVGFREQLAEKGSETSKLKPTYCQITCNGYTCDYTICPTNCPNT